MLAEIQISLNKLFIEDKEAFKHESITQINKMIFLNIQMPTKQEQ